MSAINFQPVFDYLDNNFKKSFKEELKEIFVTKVEFQKKFDTLMTAVDGIANQLKKYRQEQIVGSDRIDHLENWAKPVGDKLNLPLTF